VILDQHGRPVSRAAIAGPQTARVAHLHSEFAGHPVRGLTPARLARILEDAEQGDLVAQADLFEDMEEKDGHILAELGKRKRAILTLGWDVLAPRDAGGREKAAADYAREVLLDYPDFDDLLFDLMDAVGKGYSCAEIEWRRAGGEILPASIAHRPPRWFTVDRATRSEIRLRSLGSIDGEPLAPFGWVTHVHKAKSGYVARGGLGRVLCWPFIFKNFSVRDLAEFLEIYGLPLRLGTYPTGSGDDEKATLLRAVTSIGHAAAGIVPEGMRIEFQEAAKGQSDPFETMIDWCERTQSKAILGQVLSAEAKNTGLGSGVAELQGEVRRDLMLSDARQVAGTVTRDIVYPILALNKGIDNLRSCPRFVFDTSEAEDLALYSEALPRLAGIGMRIPVGWAHEKLKIPAAGRAEDVLSAPLASLAPLKGRRTTLPEAGEDVTPIDPMTERMAVETAPAWGAMLDHVRAIVEGAESLDALRDALLAAYGDLPADELAAAMAMGFAAAELSGRYDLDRTSDA